MSNKWKWLGITGFSLALLSACSAGNGEESASSEPENSGSGSFENAFKVYEASAGPINLEAKETTIDLGSTNFEAWTYGNTVPGPQIRATVGDTVEVNLQNTLPEPVTIHWHGIPLPNNMDGIPGVTQNAIQPGEEFTYKFTAEDPGTYWYHSHQNGSVQVDKGLYGTIIVEEEEKSYDKDFTLVFDEWQTGSSMEGMDSEDEDMSGMEGMDSEGEDMSGMEGMDSEGEDMSGMEGMDSEGEDMSDMEGMDSEGEDMSGMEESGSEAHDMAEMYDTFTINGKTGDSIPEIEVEKGERIRLRLVNAGNMEHMIDVNVPGFKVVATDGQPIENPPVIQDQLIRIGPGERYDIEFTVEEEGSWHIDCHAQDMEGMDGMEDMSTVIRTAGATDTDQKEADDAESMPIFDFTSYGELAESPFSLDDEFDVEYEMDLNTRTGEDGEAEYTINDKVFPNTDPLSVAEGDKVKVTFQNNSTSDVHPMHLHGMFFQVLSKNGEPLTGAPIIKDTLNIQPGESYEVAFLADNPGDWMFHCHDLHHASAGMVTLVEYEGFEPDFTPDPDANNQPE